MFTDVAWRRRALGLEAENIGLCTDNAKLKAQNRRLQAECRRLGGEVTRLTARVTELLSRIEALRRASKRQAAPHSKGTHVKHPKRSGRRPGEGYGTKAYRKVPEHVDEVVEVPCPTHCDCGGEVELDGALEQWVQDIPPVKVRTRLVRIHKGRCRCCGKLIRGRHPEQTSEAAGAAASQVGPYATALAVDLKKEMGVSERKICRLFSHFGLRITPGGVAQAIARAGRRATPTYRGLVLAVRRAEVVTADETGWRVRNALAGVLALAVAPGSFTVSEFTAKVHAMTGQRKDDYSIRQAAYDLRKLRGKHLVDKPGRSRRYLVPGDAARTVAGLSVMRDQVIAPILAGLRRSCLGERPSTWTRIDDHYETLRSDMRNLLEDLGITTESRMAA